MGPLIDYISSNWDVVLSLLVEHIRMTSVAVIIALAIGVPLGIFISYYEKSSPLVLGIANLLQAVPSMALLGLAIPIMGIGVLPATVVVILYSLLPIIKNTHTGIIGIDEGTMEAARGIGLTPVQILTRVQIPMAMPVIMAGVRISAVSAVGLMTMAAFIGAGGLGFLVFSGINTMNTPQIIWGAIPAAILALLVDYLFGFIEKILTPTEKIGAFGEFLRRHKKWVIIVLVILLLLPVFWGVIGPSDQVITVGGYNFTEQYILTHLMADLIEDRTDLRVSRRDGLGGSKVAFGALISGEIDIYIEYTGTVYNNVLKMKPTSDIQYVYDVVKNDLKEMYDVDTLDQFNFNNTYVMAVKPETSEEYNLTTLSDLKQVAGDLSAGITMGFMGRDDGLPALKDHYGIEFKEEVAIDGTNRYLALMSGDTDIIDAFATDGLLARHGLTLLEDDEQFFPPYYAVPIMASGVLEEHPELEGLLAELGEVMTDENMRNLNYLVDEEGKEPRDVAHDFLIEQGLIEQ